MPCAYVAEWQESASHTKAGTLQPGAFIVANNALAQLVVGQDTAKEPVLRLKTGSFAV